MSYKKKYDLDANNCTTFARDALNSTGIKNKVIIDFKPEGEIHFTNFFVGSAGSPGQASYSIQENYPNDHVYVVEEVLDDGGSQLWFTSKMAQECAVKMEKEEQEEEDSQLNLPNVNDVIDKEIEEQEQKATEWLEQKIEEWLNEWLAENCGGC